LLCTFFSQVANSVEFACELVCVVTMRRLLTVLSTCLWACGDNSVGAKDAGTSDAWQPAAHIPLPQVFPHSGTVLSSVQMVTVTFDDYPAQADVVQFGQSIVTSSWYTSAGTEYSVHAGAQIGTVQLRRPPGNAMSRQDIRTQIANLATSDLTAVRAVPAVPPVPAVAAPEPLYVVYVPADVAITDLDGRRSYHDVIKLGDGGRVPLAVVLDDGSGTAATLLAAAHQLIDTATDPFPPPRDGFYADPPASDPWSLALGEIADLCEGEDLVSDGGYALPRVYSNRAVTAGQSPCTPVVPNDTYNDVSATPPQMPTVAAGSSAVYVLTGWSTREIPDWSLSLHAADRSDFTLLQMSPDLSSDMINNKSKVTLTLRVPPDAISGQTGGVYVLSGDKHPWAVGFVVK
jgi:hypothetical protein